MIKTDMTVSNFLEDLPKGRKLSSEFKFRYYANDKFAKFKSRLLLYF